ncbi:MAG: hypothetical protein ABG776_01710 [Cyanobacteria bacterium J06555_13]
MNNFSTNHFSEQATLSQVDDNAPEITQYITFKLSGYLFALPTREVLRIVATPPPSQGGLIKMGMVQLGPYSIEMIDLPSLLALKDSPKDKHSAWPSVASSRALENRKQTIAKEASHQNPPFLIVLQNAEKDLWGIAVYEPPDLMEVPDYALKPVPSQHRLTRALRWVSHVVSYDLNSDRHSLLILDLSIILAPKRTEPIPEENPRFMEIKPPLDAKGETVKRSEMYI